MTAAGHPPTYGFGYLSGSSPDRCDRKDEGWLAATMLDIWVIDGIPAL